MLISFPVCCGTYFARCDIYFGEQKCAIFLQIASARTVLRQTYIGQGLETQARLSPTIRALLDMVDDVHDPRR